MQQKYESSLLTVTVEVNEEAMQSVSIVRNMALYLLTQLSAPMVNAFALAMVNLVRLVDKTSTQALARVYADRVVNWFYLANQQICDEQFQVSDGTLDARELLAVESAFTTANRKVLNGPFYNAIEELDMDLPTNRSED